MKDEIIEVEFKKKEKEENRKSEFSSNFGRLSHVYVLGKNDKFDVQPKWCKLDIWNL